MKICANRILPSNWLLRKSHHCQSVNLMPCGVLINIGGYNFWENISRILSDEFQWLLIEKPFWFDYKIYSSIFSDWSLNWKTCWFAFVLLAIATVEQILKTIHRTHSSREWPFSTGSGNPYMRHTQSENPVVKAVETFEHPCQSKFYVLEIVAFI